MYGTLSNLSVKSNPVYQVLRVPVQVTLSGLNWSPGLYLFQLRHDEHSTEAYMAQSVLEIHGLAEYDEVIVMPGVQPRSMKAHEDNQVKKRKGLASVHPNPTRDMAYLNWRLPEGLPPHEVSMAVYSIHGQQLLTGFLDAEVGIREINTANWAPGLYLFQLRHDERLIESIRFEVIR